MVRVSLLPSGTSYIGLTVALYEDSDGQHGSIINVQGRMVTVRWESGQEQKNIAGCPAISDRLACSLM